MLSIVCMSISRPRSIRIPLRVAAAAAVVVVSAMRIILRLFSRSSPRSGNLLSVEQRKCNVVHIHWKCNVVHIHSV